MTASFVLTFHGIEFFLDSKQSGATIAFDHANSSNEEILLTLNNFTGNLRVSTATSPSIETSSPSSSKTSTTTATTSGRVSLSPEHRPAQSKSKQKTTRRPQPPATTQKTKVTNSRAATSTSNNDASTDDDTTNHKRRVVSCEEDSLPSCSKKGKHHETIDAPTATPTTNENNTTTDSITPDESAAHKISPDGRKQQSSPSTVLIPSSSSSSSSCSVVSVPTIGSDKSLARLPSARWGHTMSWIDDKTKILVYGGQTLNDDNMIVTGMMPTTTHGDLYVYDTLTNEFAKPVHCEGVERQWHSSVYLAERQLLIAFGGEAPTGNKGKMETLNQVMVLDTEIMLWYPPTVTGEIPAGRSGHSASILGSSSDMNHLSMVVFGGVGKGNKYQRTVSVLDTVRWKWTTCTKIVGDAPRPRSYHTATSIVVQQPQQAGANQNNATTTKDWIVIIGGNDHDRCFNSVHVLEVRGDCWSWINPIVSGDIPAPRTGHVAVLLEDGKTIFVHGGWDPNAEDEDQEVIFNDCFLLDTTTWVWTKLDQTVPARVGHRAVQCEGGVQMFGGRLEGGKFSNDLLKVNVEL